jgi:Spy/CpxP family protein refolding chaperone
MKRSTLWATLALAATVGVASLALAQGGPGPADRPDADRSDEGWSDHDAPRGPRGGGEAFERLDLTDAQREKLAEVRDKHRRAAVPIEGDLKLARMDLEKLMRSEKPDANAVSRQVDKISNLRGQLMKNRLTGLIEAKAVLTPEQQKKLKDMRGPGGRGMRGMRGMRGGSGDS